MLTPDLLHDYQKKAVNFQCTHPNSMLWLDMGLGKTVITLTSLAHLIKTQFLRGVIIVAPIRVIRLVWRQEAAKWEHTKHLKFSMVTGTKDQRTRALLRPADVYMINYENMKWLAEVMQTYFISKGRPLPFNGVVWDEVSKMKNSTTNRVHAWFNGKRNDNVLDHFVWRTGLTGTPASNGYKDLHGQFLVVDGGMRLGKFKTAFMTQWYKKAGDSRKDIPYRDTEEGIKNLIGDITLEMSAEDYNPLPDLIVNNIEIEMPDELRTKYDRLEKEFFMVLDSGKEVEAFNAAALTNKCLQFSNGAMYPIAGMPLWEAVHDLKLEALEEILDEAQGSPVLCSYAYRSDAERIMERFKAIRPINLTECKSEASLVDAMHRWKTGDCQLMIGHPACLHPKTEVLTEWRGWVKIVDVLPDERVFDGVEFVNHKGCSYSGYKNVIDVFGITMTSDHKLLIDNQWVKAKDVQDTRSYKQKALYQWKNTSNCQSAMFDLRDRTTNDSAKCNQEQSTTTSTLFTLHKSNISQNDRYSNLENLVRSEIQSKGHYGQKLRRSWYNGLSRMGEFFQFLQRYVGRLWRPSNHRENRREQTVSEKQLPVGNQHGTTIQQEKQSPNCIQQRSDTSCGVSKTNRIFQNDVVNAIKPWNVCRPSSSGLSNIKLWEKSKSDKCSPQTKAHVYDLVDCGPRHQFLIRNSQHEMFISHNSMGHGIDGLQKNGHILVWYGLNWSLDLYEQFNARVRRQGQGAPVMCHRILMQNTLDQAQSLALDEKATTQSGLRTAVKQYRQSKGV